MKKIICFGDSNTFGFNPVDGSRYDSNTRWTGILAELLGESFEIAEEGCNNRTGFCQNLDGEELQILQSGQEYLPLCLEKHNDFDIFILALGTNDLQFLFKIDENIIIDGLKKLIARIKKFGKNSRIIIIPPVVLCENILNGYFKCQFDENSIRASVWIQKIYENFVKENNCEILDINKYVKPSEIDGLHFSAESHGVIAKLVADKISRRNDPIGIVEKC